MLRVALPNKGQLAEPARDMLHEAGYLRSSGARDLVVQDPDNDVEFFFLRPKDIAIYVGEGTLDLGITGRDMLLDSGADAEEVAQLGFGGSTFRLAAPVGTATTVIANTSMPATTPICRNAVPTAARIAVTLTNPRMPPEGMNTSSIITARPRRSSTATQIVAFMG